MLCDISGSMERHSRLLLRFIQALSAASEVRTESFVFGTRLTRVTRLMRDRDRDRALLRVADSVNDWAGGTRIGVVSASSTRSGPAARSGRAAWSSWSPTAGTRRPGDRRDRDGAPPRNCHRLVWLNPLAGTPGYQPLAAGMRAAYPFIDDFLPAGTVASLERLGEILAGVRARDTVSHSEAAARGAPPGGRGRPGGDPAAVDRRRLSPLRSRPSARGR